MSKRQPSVRINREKMRRLRIEKGITQQFIAFTLGYSQARITQIETGSGGDYGVPIGTLNGIAMILEVEPEELLA